MSIKTSETGSLASYIVGFLLSLICTVIPYYLVVSKSVTGNTLLATILEFAVFQMAIQLLFFLHLGRGKKPFYNVIFFFCTAGAIFVVVVGSLFIMNNLHYNMSPSAAEVTTKLSQDEGIAQVNGLKTGACQVVKTNHIITIKDGKASPILTQANQCDTLVFMSEDAGTRTITFGQYPEHETYSGENDIAARKNYPGTITLNQIGTYTFHDLNDPNLTGIFTVSP